MQKFISPDCRFVAVPRAAWGQGSADDKAKQMVDGLCNTCHPIGARTGSGYTLDGWKTVMRMMTNHGVPVPPDQVGPMTEYLAKVYPVKGRPDAVIVPGPVKVSMKAWQAATPGSRPHDPLAARDGSLWYTGQMINALGRVDPKTGQVKEFPLKTAHSGPHGLVEDKGGNIWYTGNTGNLVGKLNPKTGEVTEYTMPEPGDPHTLLFDARGILWFTMQNANRIGRLDPKSGNIKLLTPPTAKSRPYGMALDPKGNLFVVQFGTNRIARVDPKTLEIREYTLPDAASRPRRLTITGDGLVWWAWAPISACHGPRPVTEVSPRANRRLRISQIKGAGSASPEGAQRGAFHLDADSGPTAAAIGPRSWRTGCRIASSHEVTLVRVMK